MMQLSFLETMKSRLWPCSILLKHGIDPVVTAHRASCPDPTVHLKLLTSSTADSIRECVECRKKKKRKLKN